MAPLSFQMADGSLRIVRGYRYVPPDASTRRYSASREKLSRVPPRVDLRSWMTPVEDQLRTNSCGANATAGAYEYLVKRHLGDGAFYASRGSSGPSTPCRPTRGHGPRISSRSWRRSPGSSPP